MKVREGFMAWLSADYQQSGRETRAAAPICTRRARARGSGRRDGRDGSETGQDLSREEPDALLRLRVGHVARAPDQDQVAEPADLVVEVHDLAVDPVGAADEEDPALHRLLGGHADERRGVLAG